MSDTNGRTKRLPLRIARPFLESNGLSAEADKIWSSTKNVKDRGPRLRRGLVVEVLKWKSLLDTFIAQHWTYGATKGGDRERREYAARVKDWREKEGGKLNFETEPSSLSAAPAIKGKPHASLSPEISREQALDYFDDLMGILNSMERTGKNPSEPLDKRISRLREAGLIPKNIAILMQTLRLYRNFFLHDKPAYVARGSEALAIDSMHRAIREWASTNGF